MTVAFISLPKLAAVLFPFTIWMLGLFFLIEWTVKKQSRKAEAAYSLSNTFLEQCFAGIRVVQTFAMSQPLMEHWDTKFLKKVEMLQTRPGLVRSIKIAWCHFALCIILAAGYYYGWSLKDEGYQPGSIFNVSPSLLDIQLDRYMLTQLSVSTDHHLLHCYALYGVQPLELCF